MLAKFAHTATWNIALAALLAEVALRVFDPLGVAYFPETARYFADMAPNPDYAYIHRPGRHRYGGVDVQINSSGLRGPEIAPHPAPAAPRLVVLGDSIVFGWGADQDETFPWRLRNLAQGEGIMLEVVPVGAGSWNTRTEWEFLRKKGAALEADILALFVVPNDLEPHLDARTDIPKDQLAPPGTASSTWSRLASRLSQAIVPRSYLLMHVRYFSRTRQARKAEAMTGADSPKWTDGQLALDGIIHFTKSRGIHLVVFLYGSPADVRQKPVLDLYRRHLEMRGVTWYALPDAVFTDRSLQISVIDPHPNSAGHAAIAEVVWRELRALVRESRNPSATPAKTPWSAAPADTPAGSPGLSPPS